MVETAKYKITGLVDYTDEQGNIVGQLPVGSVQELPVEVGDKAVEEGRAEVADLEDADETATGSQGQSTADGENGASGDASDDDDIDGDDDNDEDEVE